MVNIVHLQYITLSLLALSLVMIAFLVLAKRLCPLRALSYAVWASHAVVFYVALILKHAGILYVDNGILNLWSSAIRLQAVLSFFAQIVIDRRR